MKDFFNEIFSAFEADVKNLFRRRAGIKSDIIDVLQEISEAMKEILSESVKENKSTTPKDEKKPYWHWLDEGENNRYTYSESFYQEDDYGYSERWGNFHQENFFKKSSSQPFNRKITKLPYDAKIASYYVVLGLPYASSLSSVKSTWKQLCKKYHPDYFTNNPSMQKYGNGMLIKATEAYKEIEKYLKLYGLG